MERIRNHYAEAPEARTDYQDSKEQEFSFLTLPKVCERDAWIIDSSAASHMCVNLDYFVTLDRSVKQIAFLADGKKITTEG